MFVEKYMLLPRNDSTNGWSGIIAPRTPNAPLTQNETVDWVVVGGGLAGLAAARRLAENRPGDTIAIVEAQRVGEGAQGRNSGFAIDAPHNVGSSMGELAAAHSHLRLARAAIAYLNDQVHTHGIDCDWRVDGKFHAAVTQEGIDTVLKPTLKTLETMGEPHEWLQGQALHDKL